MELFHTDTWSLDAITCIVFDVPSPQISAYTLSLSTLSQKSATVAENGENGDSLTFLPQCGQGFIFLETTIIGVHFAADNIGLSLFKFLWWAHKFGLFLQE